MSYDLFFKPGSGNISLQAFKAYFEGRKHYIVEEQQAWYQNDDTGVYFVFEYQADGGEEGGESYPVAFNMNYFRPTYFVKEAEPEISNFVSHFSMIVDDPQINGMGVGEYSAEKFAAGWLHGNDFGCSAIIKDHPEVATLPSETLYKFWKWNYEKENLQEAVTDEVFVPTIMILNYRDNQITACVWPDAIPSVIPKVDFLIIGRKDLAPKKWFKTIEDIALGSWADFQPLLEKYKTKMEGEAYYLSYDAVPGEIQNIIKALPPADMKEFERLSSDQVIDREIVQKYAG